MLSIHPHQTRHSITLCEEANDNFQPVPFCSPGSLAFHLIQSDDWVFTVHLRMGNTRDFPRELKSWSKLLPRWWHQGQHMFDGTSKGGYNHSIALEQTFGISKHWTDQGLQQETGFHLSRQRGQFFSKEPRDTALAEQAELTTQVLLSCNALCKHTG